jgi:hypothetical protein
VCVFVFTSFPYKIFILILKSTKFNCAKSTTKIKIYNLVCVGYGAKFGLLSGVDEGEEGRRAGEGYGVKEG